MKILDYKEYNELRSGFFKKHGGLDKVETSPMDEYGVYYKTYIAEDGKILYERMAPKYESQEIEVKRVKCTVTVKLLEVEIWSSDFGSHYYYEKF